MSKKSESSGLNDLSSRVRDIETNPSKDKCASGVRKTLNALFGKNTSYGDIDPGGPLSINAKDYDEEVLSQWQTKDKKYREVLPGGTPENYEIRIYKPNGTCSGSAGAQYGHIEIFINGAWYSDHKQVGSANGNSCFSGPSVYRLSPK